MGAGNIIDVRVTESFTRNVKVIIKKDPGFLLRVSKAIIFNHSTATGLGDSLFKIRLARANAGKRDGYRIFYYVTIDQIAFLLDCVDKKEKENLSSTEIEIIREVARNISLMEKQEEQT